VFFTFFTWISETDDYLSLPDTYEFEMSRNIIMS